jgi:hypothetical protein
VGSPAQKITARKRREALRELFDKPRGALIARDRTKQTDCVVIIQAIAELLVWEESCKR